MSDTKKQLGEITSHSPVTTTRVASLQIGERVRQGDIYITRVADSQPRGKPWGSRQVAVGNSVGSRHVAVGDVEVFAGAEASCAKLFPGWGLDQLRACVGPIVVSRGDWVLEHPEHPHHQILGGGTYQVSYQWNAQTRRAVED